LLVVNLFEAEDPVTKYDPWSSFKGHRSCTMSFLLN